MVGVLDGTFLFPVRSHSCQLLERDPLHYSVITQTNPGGEQHSASRGLGSALSSLQCFHISVDPWIYTWDFCSFSGGLICPSKLQ